MGEVHFMSGTTARECSDDVVSHLEELLEMAKSGELVGMVCALSLADKSSSWRLSGHYNASVIGSGQMALTYCSLKLLE